MTQSKHIKVLLLSASVLISIICFTLALRAADSSKDKVVQNVAKDLSNAVPPFNSNVSISNLLELCSESYQHLPKEAAINKALYILIHFSHSSYYTTNDSEADFDEWEKVSKDMKKTMKEKIMRDKGEKECSRACSDPTFSFFFDEGLRFSRKDFSTYELEYVHEDGLDLSFYDDMIVGYMNQLRTGGACVLPIGSGASSDPPFDRDGSRKWTVDRIKSIEEWEAPYLKWFYDMLLYYARSELQE